MRDAAESQVSAVELFLNSVPILNPLSREEKLRLVDAFEQRAYTPGAEVGAAPLGARRGMKLHPARFRFGFGCFRSYQAAACRQPQQDTGKSKLPPRAPTPTPTPSPLH